MAKYENSLQLEDGVTLKLKYSAVWYGPSHPENDVSDVEYFLDGVEVDINAVLVVYSDELSETIVQKLIDEADEVKDEY